MRRPTSIPRQAWLLVACLLLACIIPYADAWVPFHFRHGTTPTTSSSRPTILTSSYHRRYPQRPSITTTTTAKLSSSTTTTTQLYGLFDFLTNPYDSKIPSELQDEIYRAEANTEAAKDRGTRIALYTILAIVGIGLAVFNGFLTELRINGLPEPDGNVDVVAAMNPLNSAAPSGSNNLDILNQAGFGWVLQNPLYKFMFTNKIGGAMCLLMGGGSALLAEAEFDSKRINAEKIYEELERRREQKVKGGGGATSVSKQQRKKKKQSGKQKKSLKALSEVIATTEEEETSTAAAETASAPETPQEEVSKDEGSGIFGKVKDLYDQADSMAASQALLLNKKLEDAGVVDKITDETGLKVIGKEEAAKRQQDGAEKDKQ